MPIFSVNDLHVLADKLRRGRDEENGKLVEEVGTMLRVLARNLDNAIEQGLVDGDSFASVLDADGNKWEHVDA